MAAQAVDFTISGQVSRTLFINSSDTSTEPKSVGSDGEIRDNNGSTRIRANGSTEMDDGSTLGIQFEYSVDSAVSLRHANVQYTTAGGRITFGQGSEAGDGSASAGVGVTGLGAGQDGTKATSDELETGANAGTAIKLGSYFGSLDGGTRTGMIRYDTPALGPVSAAVSVGNGDRVSGLISVATDVGGTAFAAKLGAYRMGDESSISGAAGLTLASGFAVAGAWGKGTDVAVLGTGSAGMAATDPVVQKRSRELWWTMDPNDTAGQNFRMDPKDSSEITGTLEEKLALLFTAVPDDPNTTKNDAKPALTLENLAFDGENSATQGSERRVLEDQELMDYRQWLQAHSCLIAAEPMGEGDGALATTTGANSVDSSGCQYVRYGPDGYTENRTVQAGTAAEPAGTDRLTDPSYVTARIGYTFGNTTVAASWYSSKDFIWEGSTGTAIGFGASHALPKVGATVHASVQNYVVDFPDGFPGGPSQSQKETVFQLGTLVTF